MPVGVRAMGGEATGTPLLFLRELWIVARYSLLQQGRSRSWIFNTSLTPFFLMAPLLFVATSFLAAGGQRWKRSSL